MIRNGNNMISVHEWMQPTQERTTRPNSESAITSATKLGADQDLKPSRKCQKSPILPLSLCNDPQWQQNDFSAWVDPTNPREDHKAKFRVGHHLCHGAGDGHGLKPSPKLHN